MLVAGCGSEAGSDLLAGAAPVPPPSSVQPPPDSTEPAPAATVDPTVEADAALASWRAYQVGVLGRDGAATAAVLTGESIDYYAALLDAALHATTAELDRMPVVDVTTVLIARLRYTADTLDDLDGRGFVELTVRDGLVDESTAEGVSFDRAEVDGSTALLRTSAPDQALQALEMRREADGWKVHLVAALRELGQPLESYAETEGLAPSAASLELIRRRAPNVTDSVFQPLRPRA